MSLTVSQLLELPCLRRAKILAGHRSLDRIVTSISVLEYSTPTETQKKLYDSIEFWGSELVITGFCNVANDVDAQCANIRSMAAAGEVGMILYYVGLILPSVDPRLIQLADELDFVLICMPENEPNLRYSEVIQEGMGAIIRDELNNPTFTLDLLEQIAKVPKTRDSEDHPAHHQRPAAGHHPHHRRGSPHFERGALAPQPSDAAGGSTAGALWPQRL